MRVLIVTGCPGARPFGTSAFFASGNVTAVTAVASTLVNAPVLTGLTSQEICSITNFSTQALSATGINREAVCKPLRTVVVAQGRLVADRVEGGYSEVVEAGHA